MKKTLLAVCTFALVSTSFASPLLFQVGSRVNYGNEAGTVTRIMYGTRMLLVKFDADANELFKDEKLVKASQTALAVLCSSNVCSGDKVKVSVRGQDKKIKRYMADVKEIYDNEKALLAIDGDFSPFNQIVSLKKIEGYVKFVALSPVPRLPAPLEHVIPLLIDDTLIIGAPLIEIPVSETPISEPEETTGEDNP